MTHTRLERYSLTLITKQIVRVQPKHERLAYLFWRELEDGLIAPLFGLAEHTQAAFGGMTWLDLQVRYASMLWIDEEVEAESFALMAKRYSLL
jgi:hypothetical protein